MSVDGPQLPYRKSKYSKFNLWLKSLTNDKAVSPHPQRSKVITPRQSKRRNPSKAIQNL